MSDTPFRYKPRRNKLDLGDNINGVPILDMIARLAAYRHTQKEAAALLGVGHSTLKRFFEENAEAREAWQDGRQMCKATIRRLIFMHAKSDPSTARYLANNMLEMTSDGKQESDVPGGVERLSRDEAKKRILELQAITSTAKPAASKSRALTTRP